MMGSSAWLPRLRPRGVAKYLSGPWASSAPSKRALAAEWKSFSEALSYAEGPSEPSLYSGTIPQHFAGIASRYGDRPAVIARAPVSSSAPASSSPVQETTLTYAALDALSNRLACSLRSVGVRKGDRVAVSLGNCAEYAALAYALYKLGAVFVPLNPGFTVAQVESALAHLGASTLIAGAVTDLAYKPCRGRSNEPLLRDLVADLDGSGGVESEKVPSLERVVLLDNYDNHPDVPPLLRGRRALTPYASLLDGSPSAFAPETDLLPSDTINIQFTSGTTSQPKAAMLSHTSILNNGALIAHRMGLAPDDRIVCPPPFFHCFGLILGYMATATTGAAILFPSPAFDPVAALRMCADRAATGLHGVSTMMVAALELLDRGMVTPAPKHLRKGIVAGSSVPEALMRRLYARLGLRDLVICYGMTETSPVSCMTTPADPLAKRTASVGRAMPHTAVKVVGPDRAQILPRGERGELAVSGYLVMAGYYGDEARTRADRVADEDGRVWMYTGDEAAMDADGYVAVTGRIKDLIIRGGENIHPLEVENCLFQHPAVAEVSVVGVPDERYGESVGAFVVPKQGVAVADGGGGAGASGPGATTLSKEEVREWVRQRLSGHLVPKHVFWVEDYPKTASGKIQKYKLREMAKELLGMKE